MSDLRPRTAARPSCPARISLPAQHSICDWSDGVGPAHKPQAMDEFTSVADGTLVRIGRASRHLGVC